MRESFFNSWNYYEKIQRLCLIVFFGVFLYLRFHWRVSNLELVGDELALIKATQMKFFYFLTHYAGTSEYHLPGSFLLVYGMAHWIGNGLLVVSIPFYLISSAAYWLIALINWRRILDLNELKDHLAGWINVIACILITYNSSQIIHSFEARPYSTLTLLSLLALWLSWAAYSAQKFQFRHLVSFVSIAIFHNFGLLMLLISGGYWILRELVSCDRKIGGLRNAIGKSLAFAKVYSVGSVLSMAFIAFFILKSPIFSLANTTVSFGRNTFEYIQSGWRGAIQVVAIYYGFFGWLKLLRFLLLLCLAGGTVWLVHRKKWVALISPLVLVILPTFIIYGSAVLSNYWFIQRQFVWVMPYWAVYNAVCFIICCQLGYEWIFKRLSSRTFS